jgi:hypothetical protein
MRAGGKDVIKETMKGVEALNYVLAHDRYIGLPDDVAYFN